MTWMAWQIILRDMFWNAKIKMNKGIFCLISTGEGMERYELNDKDKELIKIKDGEYQQFL